MKEGFKRINFFKGFFTQAEDWQSAQEYHLEKRKIHNRFLHTTGIVYGCLDSLKVTATDVGNSLFVAPGYAIDGEGHDLYLPNPWEEKIVPQDYNPPATVYIIIRHNEEEIDKRVNAANHDLSGFAFIKEYPVIEITTEEPDNRNLIELARINLSKEATRVKNPESPDTSGSNELDTRYIKKAGVIRSPIKMEELGKVVLDESTRIGSKKEYAPRIEELKGEHEDQHPFYLASVYPVEDSEIIWHIRSERSKGSIVYKLIMKNISENSANVSYKVFRFS